MRGLKNTSQNRNGWPITADGKFATGKREGIGFWFEPGEIKAIVAEKDQPDFPREVTPKIAARLKEKCGPKGLVEIEIFDRKRPREALPEPEPEPNK